MATDMTELLQNDPVRNPQILARIPAGRWGTPEDLKGAAVFLASAASDYLQGAIIPVDGGVADSVEQSTSERIRRMRLGIHAAITCIRHNQERNTQ